jgi:kynurenine formamidase
MFSAVVDLTHEISEKSPNWEGTEKSPFEAKQLGSYEKEGYFSRVITLPEHFSTHVDAPAHFARGRWTVDQIPPERLVAPLVVIDIKAQCRTNPDYQLSMDDVARWERANGRIPAGAVVMANTGWSAKWDSMADYRGADKNGTMHFPGFSLDAVKFLVQARNIFGLGIDTMGVDYGRSETYPVHRYTGSMNIYHVENVADLDRAPEVGAVVVVAPAKLKGGSGGPVRVLALIKEPGQ